MKRRYRTSTSIRFAPSTWTLLKRAVRTTGKTQTEVIERCIVAQLAKEEPSK